MDYLSGLNRQQLEAVTYDGQSLLILAGAGSGKTRVITSRIAWLIAQQGINPRSILAVTFTNKAAGEMRERVEHMVPGASSVMIRTFHSFGAWFMRNNSHFTPDLKSSFSIYDDDDALSLLQSIFPESQKKKLQPYAGWISRARDYCLTPADDLSEITHTSDFPSVYAAYDEKLRKIGNLDFGSLITRPVELLESNTEVLERTRQRFRIILVDEYQDSNVAQYRLLKMLAGDSNSVCVVGDDDQSIYKFRGAEVRNILSFPEEFEGTKIIRLEQNYRSTNPILEIASGVVENNSNRLGKKLWTEKTEGQPAKIVYLERDTDEAEFCASLLADGNYKNTAILYRTNAQSRSFETCFIRAGIPYRIVGALRFLEREEIKDVMAILSLIVNPADEVAFNRVVNKPARGIGKTGLRKIIDYAVAEGIDLICALKEVKGLSAKACTGAEKFAGYIENMRKSLAVKPLGEFVAEVIEESGLLAHYTSKDEIAAKGRADNLNEMISAAGIYGEGEEALSLFLEELELDRSTLPGMDDGDDENAVTLITMHNTKGLEFDRVIITGMEEGLFPSGREETGEELEEERRIFYVSITRARDELYFTSCRSRMIWGQFRQQAPSIFLHEISRDHAEVVDMVSKPGKTSAEAENPAYRNGRRVYHDDYGNGFIIKSGSAGGHDYVMIKFETGKTGRFLPDLDPHLEFLENDEWF